MDWWNGFFESEYYGQELEKIPVERTKAEVDFAVSALGLKKRARILDLCCGMGRHSIEFARRGLRVAGLDYSAEYLESARLAAKEEGVRVEFVRGDMRKIPWANHFDAVTCLFTSFGFFESDAENFKVFGSAAKSLKPGGKFMLETANREWLMRNFQPVSCSEDTGQYLIETRTLDIKRDLIVSKWTWIRDGKKTEHESRVKTYPYSTLGREMEKRGLRIVASYGGFDGGEYSHESRRMIIVAEKRK